jgi:hypothetical protein
MTLFKRGRIWWTGFYVEGKRFQFTTNQSNRQLAEKVEQKLKDRAELARYNITIADPTLTFSQLVTEFRKKAKITNFHESRLTFLEASFGDTPVIRITKNAVEEYRNTRKAAKPNLKDSTLNRDVAVIRRIFYWAQEQGLIAQNPLTRVTMVRERRIKKPILSIHHEHLILQVAKPGIVEEAITTNIDNAIDTAIEAISSPFKR